MNPLLRAKHTAKPHVSPNESEVPTATEPVRSGEPPITGLFPSLKWRILSIAALSIFSLVAYLGVLFVETGKSAALLSDIQNKSYPVQEHMMVATHALDVINRELKIAAITGDEDTIRSTLPLAETYRYELERIVELDTANREPIRQLLERFEEYYASATVLATQILEADSDLQQLRSDGRLTNAMYSDLTRSATRFLNELRDDLKNSIASTTTFASWMVNFLLWTGLCAVGLVCYSATRTASLISSRIEDMVSVLKKIAQNENDLSARIILTGKDEITELGYWFNSFISKLEIINTNATNEILNTANTDYLSGLPNRRYLLNSIDSLIASDTEQELTFTLFFLDLDEFKPINDELGHDAGDQLLTLVAQRLRSACSDIIIRHKPLANHKNAQQLTHSFEYSATAARLGGDEFVVLVTNLSGAKDIRMIANNLISEIAKPYVVEAGSCVIGTSIGIAQYPADGATTRELIEHADIALYKAKADGKNQFSFYAAQGSEQAVQIESISPSLLDIHSQLDVDLSFQANFSLSGRSDLISVDAALSGIRAELETQVTDKYLTLADQAAPTSAIDSLLIDKACAQFFRWQEFNVEILPITVVISAESLLKRPFVSALELTLEKYAIEPDHLCLELAESTNLVKNKALNKAIDSVRDMGLLVGISDLSIGCTSAELAIVNQIDRLSFNSSLISAIHADQKKQAIVTSICALATQLDIETLATGVENRHDFEFLKSTGCRLAQGSYLEKPLTESELTSAYTSSTSVQKRYSAHG